MVSRGVRFRCVAACLLIAATCLGSPAWPQAPVALPVGDPAYRSIDLLVATGLVDAILIGQRPYLRSEIGRVLAEAWRNAEGLGPTALGTRQRDALANLAQRFPLPLAGDPPAVGARHQWRLVDYAEVSVVAADGRSRSVPPDTGIGGVDALIAPLVQRTRQGRDLMNGTTLAIETAHELPIGAHLALHAQPRLRLSAATSQSGERALTLRTAGARVTARNVVLSAGRDALLWGQGRNGGLLISRNARPLDMVDVRTVHPWVPPHILRLLGPSAFSLFVADLGVRQHFPHTTLIGYKWNGRPSPGLELGVGALGFTGGRGAPGAPFEKRLLNLFLFPILPTEGYQFSNTMAGVDVRYRIPRFLRGRADAYWEINLDDFDIGRIASSVWTDDAAQLFGLAASGLGRDGRVDVTVELHHSGTRFNRHQQFLSGPTIDRVLLGEPLGPNADGGYLFIDVALREQRTIGLEIAAEEYRNDQHTLTYSPFTFHLVERRPRERRYRAVASVRAARTLLGGALRFEAGVERVDGLGFVAGTSHTNLLASVTMSHTFR